MSFEMNRTWSQALALIGANFQLLAIIAGVFLLLPTVAIYLAIPDLFTLTDFAADPEQVNARMAAIIPQMMGYGVVALVFQMVGYMAMIALMGGSRPTVGEAIVRGLKMLPTVIGAGIVFMIGYFILALVLGIVVGVIAAAVGATGSTGTMVAVVGVLYVGLLVVVAYVFARFSPLLPVIVLEPEYNPLKALGRAWRMTAPQAWAILGFFLLLFVAYIVISLVFFTIISALGFVAAGGPTGASIFILGLLAGVIGALAAMLMSGILVSLHQQLSGPSHDQLSETFE